MLYHSPAEAGKAVGAASIGSSEAIMLAGLAMKKRWAARRKAAGLSTERPNLVMSASVQVCWEKFTRYFDVEEKLAPCSEGCYVMTPEAARSLIDENTIGVVGILGSTYNGEFEDIKGMDDMVEEVNAKTGWSVPIHVDGASGGETRMFFVVVVSCLCRNCAPDTQLSESISPQNQTHTHSPKKQKKGFIAPFIYPDLEWDFRLKNVKSINVSGHKYGLVYAGVGW